MTITGTHTKVELASPEFTLSERLDKAERRTVATWRREGSDVGLEMRAFHVKERGELFVSLSRFVETPREGSSFAFRSYTPHDDIKTVSRLRIARYSAKALASMYEGALEGISSDIEFWLAWAEKIERRD